MVRIPVEYQEVEYIQGTSNARIDTGIPGNNDSLVISGKVYFNKFSAYQGFFGNYVDEDHNTSRLILYSSANGAVIVDINRKAANSSAPSVGFYAGNVVEFKVSKTKLIFNGTEYSYGGVNNATANDTNILLNVSNPASTTSNSELYRRWYYFQINDGDTALRNYIPCYRKSDLEPGMYDTVSGTFFTNAGTGEFLVGNDVSWDTATLLERRRQILLNTPHLETITDSIASFKTDVPAPLKSCKINFAPIQEGTGDPSPDNVRPISGWDEIDVGVSNENLFPKEPPTEYVYKRSTGSSNSTWASATNARASAVIPYPYNQTIHVQKPSSDKGISANISLGDTRILDIGTKYYTNEGFTNITDLTYTNPGHRKYLNLYCSTLTNFNNAFGSRQLMVSIGSSRKTYVAPQGTMHWIDFSDIGTIYGGYIDLVKGDLVETWGVITSYNGETLPGEWLSDRDVYSTENTPTIGAQVAYELAVPITHQLTPETIKTLKGTNNIWSNANGNIEVKFWKH